MSNDNDSGGEILNVIEDFAKLSINSLSDTLQINPF